MAPEQTHAARLRLPVFVYGTLRVGSWNHEQWLAPWLTRPTEPAVLRDHALHTTGGLPYVVPEPGAQVRGELATFADDGYFEALESLDLLEDTSTRHLDRVVVTVDGRDAYVYVAGPAIRAELDDSTRIASGDWLAA